MNTKFRRTGLGHRNERCLRRREVGRRSDRELAAAATEAIDCLTTVPLDRIKVRARQGWLHLEGWVNGCPQRTVLEEVTRSLEGVRGVTNSVGIQALPTWLD